jgi:hypothetical protein
MNARRRVSKASSQLKEAGLNLVLALMKPGAYIPLATALGFGVQGNMKANKTEDNVHDMKAVVAKIDTAVARGYGWNTQQDVDIAWLKAEMKKVRGGQARLKASVDTVRTETAKPSGLQSAWSFFTRPFRGKGG